MIEGSGPVVTPEDGYRKVDESTKGDFAFIHDAQEIRYMYYQVCRIKWIKSSFLVAVGIWGYLGPTPPIEVKASVNDSLS